MGKCIVEYGAKKLALNWGSILCEFQMVEMKNLTTEEHFINDMNRMGVRFETQPEFFKELDKIQSIDERDIWMRNRIEEVVHYKN